MKTRTTPIQRAIAVCGSQTELARRIGKSQQLVSYWEKKGSIPWYAASLIEAATGIPRRELRPDIFGALHEREPMA